MRDYYEQNLHNELTDLLMEAGCSVNKTGIDKLIEWIALRDTGTMDRIQNDLKQVRTQLNRHTDPFIPVRTPPPTNSKELGANK